MHQREALQRKGHVKKFQVIYNVQEQNVEHIYNAKETVTEILESCCSLSDKSWLLLFVPYPGISNDNMCCPSRGTWY